MTRFIFLLLLLAGHCRPLLLTACTASAQPAPGFAENIRAAVLQGDPARVAGLCRDWYAGGSFSPGELNWNYNALMSMEPSALLVTQRDEESYPVWVLQHALNVRPDVTVLSLESIENERYRSFLAKGGRVTLTGNTRADLLRNLLSAESERPVYFGVMLDKNMLEADQNNLYLTGLALKYSRQPFDNLPVLQSNYERYFLVDYLRQELRPEADPAKINAMNLNYIPAFLLLHRRYTAAGHPEKAAELEDLSVRVARAGNREAEVRSLFLPAKQDPPAKLSVKTIEKSMKKVGEKLWAAENETTNAQYELFLQDLLRNRNYELLDACKTAKTDWRGLLPDSLKRIPDAKVFENGHPDDPEAPVQNLSHAAAQHYCAWLTNAYNASTDKKKFRKVLFRLPTEAEWQAAAQGGTERPYPWGGYYVRNSKGCYLANLDATEPCPDCPEKGIPSNDGGFFPVYVGSYFPNQFGLYNVAGNVAEMVQESGKTRGGSWKDIPYYCQTTPAQTYTAPAPTIGFRVFMEVIEE